MPQGRRASFQFGRPAHLSLAYGPTTPDSGPSQQYVHPGRVSRRFLTRTRHVDAYPFGIWFANATTLYVADEGDGYAGGTDLYTHAAAQTTAGLQKWVFNSSTNTWNLAYTLQTGLGLGVPYTVTTQLAPTRLPVCPGLRQRTACATLQVGDGWLCRHLGDHFHD